jgi:hypothetical protein
MNKQTDNTLTPMQQKAMRRTMNAWAKTEHKPDDPWWNSNEAQDWPTCPIHGDYLQEDGTCDLCQE